VKRAIPLGAMVECCRDIETFSARVLRRPLRAYQVAPARAIIASVLGRRGLTLAVMMARQAGKNETAAHVEAYLLNAFRQRGGQLVKAAPTFRPQTLNSLLRLRGVLAAAPLPPPLGEHGYMLRVGRARALFFSAQPQANVVGATANILLEADEAQDLDADKWDKDFRPMGASTNVTTVLWGTAWSAQTLLARTIHALRELEQRDGVARVFVVPWQVVAAAVPAYGEYVRGEIARLGREHPLIKSQYFLEEIDDSAGMFPLTTQALMRGDHSRQRQPTPGRRYALLVDVGGEALALRLDEESPRDRTAATLVEIIPDALGLPRYLVRDRTLWCGTPHLQLYGVLTHLAEQWGVTRLIVDATGVGAGLAALLRHALGERVTPFIFSASSKSALGWGYLALCQAGRFLDHAEDGSPEQQQFWREVRAASYRLSAGPGQLMQWGVPEASIHDDLLISAAFCALLDAEAPSPHQTAQIVEAADVLTGVENEMGPARRH
jgi:hypothetical protein